MKWRLSSLNEFTSIVFNTELTHLGSDVSKYTSALGGYGRNPR